MTEKPSESGEFFHKAERSLRAAIVLAREGLFDDAVSRAYYAVFQAASGALLIRQKRFKSHNGLHAA
ncbi:MAG: HEPN domain-containing protein, partial [Candidatus Hydrogenedentota bacterium]